MPRNYLWGVAALGVAWALPAAAQPSTTVFFGPAPREPEVGVEPTRAAERATPVSAPTVPPVAARAEPPSPPCPRPVQVARAGGDEREAVTLLDCAGTPRDQARRALAVLMRPRHRAAPTRAELAAWSDADSDPRFLAEEVRLPHPALLARLQALAEAFPGHRLTILSGYRPSASAASRHHHAHAVDLRVEGVSAEAVRAVLVALPETGVGLSARGDFVHLDVRREAAAWTERLEEDDAPQPDAPRPGTAARAPRAPAVSVPRELAPTRAELDALRAETARQLREITVPAP